MKKEYTKKDVEKLFEQVIEDLKNNCHHTHKSGFYVGKKKIGLIRYFLSIRLKSEDKK